MFKKRIARKGGGKSGGFRTLLVCSNPAFTAFVYGFAKQDAANLTPDQLAAFKALARLMRSYSMAQAEAAFAELKVSHGN